MNKLLMTVSAFAATFPAVAFAQEAMHETVDAVVAAPIDTTNIAMALTMGLGALGPAIAIGIIGGMASSAIGRNPEAAARIQTAMILTAAFAEAIAIYSLVVALIIKFV